MTLSKEHWIFIDNYIQTLDYAAAAREIGVPNKEAPTAGLNLLANKEIQEAIKLRRSELIDAMQAIPMNKEQILATMMFQYQKAKQLHIRFLRLWQLYCCKLSLFVPTLCIEQQKALPKQ